MPAYKRYLCVYPNGDGVFVYGDGVFVYNDRLSSDGRVYQNSESSRLRNNIRKVEVSGDSFGSFYGYASSSIYGNAARFSSGCCSSRDAAFLPCNGGQLYHVAYDSAHSSHGQKIHWSLKIAELLR